MTKQKTTLIQKDPKRNHPQQLKTDIVSTYDVENPNCADLGGDPLLVCMPRTVSGRTERMPLESKRNRREREELLYIDQHIVKEGKEKRKM